MSMSQAAPNKSLRPKMVTVFVAAFLAGGTAAVGVNRFIDVNRSRSKATVECEPIFVALRDLPAGNPVTVWDVRLRDWPKAMVPQAALRPGSFEGIAWPEGHVARLSLREGQPVLRSHLQATVADVPPDVAHAVAVARPKPAVNAAASEPVAVPESPAVADSTPVARPAAGAGVPLPEMAGAVESAAIADIVASAPPATEPPPADDVPDVASSDASAEQTTKPARRDAETEVALSPTPAAPIEAIASANEREASDEAVTGEGWPSAAETAAGSEAAMRFLVVPERIAIMADELTAPRKPAAPKTPVASVATQPKAPKAGASQQQPPQSRPQSTSPRANTRQQGATQPNTKQSATTQSLPRARYPDEGSTPKKSRSTPASPAIRQHSSEAVSAEERPGHRTTSSQTPRVAVEPDAESELADEAARTPTLKSVFPNMAAGLEKIETEMTRIRRDRFGSLFRAASEVEGEADAGDGVESGRSSSQWFPYLRYR